MSEISNAKKGGADVSFSIRHKLIAMITGVSALALVFAGILIVLSQVAAFRKNMARDHLLQTEMIGNNCVAAVVFNDPEDAASVLQLLASRDSLAYASVHKIDGETLAVYRRDDFAGDPQPHPAYAEHAYTPNWLVGHMPIELDGERVGSVFLQADLREFVIFRQNVSLIVGSSLLAILVMAWIVSFKVQSLISLPIERLTAMARDVSRRRNYSVRADGKGKDEIGVLARAFNEMLSEVELRDEKLKEREQRTQAYLDIAGVMIVALDAEGRVTLINPKGCEILALPEADILGRNWFAHFIPERLRDSMKNIFCSFVQDMSSTMQYFEHSVCTGCGEERLIAGKNRVIRDEAGGLLYVLFSGEDITDHREAEEREVALQDQLARADKMKSIGVLAGGVAHDLNNMLGPLVMLPELVEDELDDALTGDSDATAQIRDSLRVMKVSANRAATVVRDLLVLSRRGHYKRIPMDISKMACLMPESACIKSLGEFHTKVNIAIKTCDDTLMVLASEDHLNRVVDNLIRNAVEAVDGAGSVTVSTSKRQLARVYTGYVSVPPGNYAVVKVIDTGSGIDADILTRIFEPFFTKKSKTDRSGSGLGLSIVHGIVRDHDGYIDVTSTVGHGTTFTLYLPLTDSKETNKSAPERHLIKGEKEHILVVDDEPGQRFLASSSLTRLGYTVGVAEDGHAAAQIFTEAKKNGQASPYDLIVLDMRMAPGFDGLDTLRAIRTHFPAQKVLIASGHAEDDRSMAALALGAKWLAKPYDQYELANTVAELLHL